ncbi:MAG TPA: hypothetical protein VMG61_15815 [Usitatibacter sp.]|nr:hypothetical protein [Usitatibacter sp.]
MNTRAPLRLNLGCGSKRMDGYVGVDLYGEPDIRLDLETFPWPWADSSVDEIMMEHVLEHLGRDPDGFIGIIKELYRVCRNGAVIHIIVPHPRHDNFLGDPTHVRPITPQVMQLFDRTLCEQFQRDGISNTPLAIYHNVDLRIRNMNMALEQKYFDMLNQKKITQAELEDLVSTRNNVVSEIRLDMEVRK